ncbi:PP2C family protein-serine/threonine phosphatase [Patescibacteria group bacterium]
MDPTPDMIPQSEISQPVQLETGWVSETGRRHSENQDRCLIIRAGVNGGVFGSRDVLAGGLYHDLVMNTANGSQGLRERSLNVIIAADGIGGNVGGDRAAIIGLQRFVITLGEETLRNGEASVYVERSLQDSAQRANADINSDTRAARRHEDIRTDDRQGTTIAGLVVREKDWFAFGAGDSRVYLLDKQRFRQLTTDHVNEVGHLTRCLGTEHGSAELDIVTGQNRPGQTFLVCSDGLTKKVEAEEIREILERNKDPQQAAEELKQAALAKGELDDITVLVVGMEAVESE